MSEAAGGTPDLEAVRQAIEIARRGVDEGGPVDLLELEALAQRICLDLAHMPQEAARESLVTVEALIAALDALAEAVSGAKQEVDQRLQAVAGGGKAAG